MKIIVHDLNPREFGVIYQNNDTDVTVISDDGAIHNCIGCFGCWIKTPGVCVLKDSYSHLTESLCKCSELIIISRCMYGSYSPFIRNVWDRSLPYLLPYFVTKNGETHHKARYHNGYFLHYKYKAAGKDKIRKIGVQFHYLPFAVFYDSEYAAG